MWVAKLYKIGGILSTRDIQKLSSRREVRCFHDTSQWLLIPWQTYAKHSRLITIPGFMSSTSCDAAGGSLILLVLPLLLSGKKTIAYNLLHC